MNLTANPSLQPFQGVLNQPNRRVPPACARIGPGPVLPEPAPPGGGRPLAPERPRQASTARYWAVISVGGRDPRDDVGGESGSVQDLLQTDDACAHDWPITRESNGRVLGMASCGGVQNQGQG